MVALALFAVLCGAVLAFRFKVFVLLPTIISACIVAAGFGVIMQLGLWSVMQAMLVSAMALQAGYLIGATARSSIALARAASRRRRTDQRRPQTI